MKTLPVKLLMLLLTSTMAAFGLFPLFTEAPVDPIWLVLGVINVVSSILIVLSI